MAPLHKALGLIKQQTELENALRRTGGIRITEERELYQMRQALTQYGATVAVIIDAAARMRRPVDTVGLYDVKAVPSAH